MHGDMLGEHLLSIGSFLLTAGLCLGFAFWLSRWRSRTT